MLFPHLSLTTVELFPHVNQRDILLGFKGTGKWTTPSTLEINGEQQGINYKGEWYNILDGSEYASVNNAQGRTLSTIDEQTHTAGRPGKPFRDADRKPFVWISFRRNRGLSAAENRARLQQLREQEAQEK